MDLRALQAFLTLSRTLHFAKTAEQCHVSASTLSRMVQRLEEQAGLVFFERDNRKVTLTKAGERFAQFAYAVLNEWQALQQDLTGDERSLRGELKIYCSVTASYSFLPPLLQRLQATYPHIELRITTGDAASAIDQLQHGHADVALAAMSEQIDQDVFFHSLTQIPLRIVAPLNNSAINDALAQNPIAWSSLPFIMPESGPARVHLEQWAAQQQFSPQIYSQVSGHEAILSLVALGLGLGIAPDAVLEHSPVKHKVKVLTLNQAPAPFNLGVCCLGKRRHERLIQALFSVL